MSDVDLRALVTLGEEALSYRGYLGRREEGELRQVQRKFDQQRRVVVHCLAKQEGTLGLHRAQAEAALLRLSRSGDFAAAAIDYSRDEVLANLAKEHRRGGLARLAVRWTLPVLGVIGSIVLFMVHNWHAFRWILP